MPPVSVLRPVCGIENHVEATLRSTFLLEAAEYEILFCVATPDDPVVPLLRRLIAEYPEVPARLLIGDDRLSGNPKLNNLVKGWAAARHDWIVMADSNLDLPPDYLRQLLARWTPGTGLVSSPAIGTRPEGPWAALECAFLDSYQARWQLVADQLGQGFAQGKTLFWRREVLEAGGGLAALGGDMAEDVAATKLVRAQGLKVRVAQAAFPQPLGHRSLAEVWSRQVRWARVRRQGFAGLYAAEILSGGFVPVLIVAAAVAVGALPVGALVALILLWYGAEALLARVAGWPHQAMDLVAMPLRDLMLPAVWLAGWSGRGFTWRGQCDGTRSAEHRRGARAMIQPDQIIEVVRAHGLMFLFPVAVLEGPIVTVIAAWLARAGYFDVFAVYGVCVLADLVGDVMLYALGRRGPHLPERWRRRLGLGGDRLQKLEAHFRDRGPGTLLFGKVTHSAGFAVLLAAGASRMPFGRFLLYNVLATLPKVLLFVLIGYSFGAAYAAIDTYIFRASLVLMALLVVAGGFWLLHRRRQS